MNLAESGEKSEGDPYAGEEDENMDKDFPFLELGAPQGSPVPSVRLLRVGGSGTDKNWRVFRSG